MKVMSRIPKILIEGVIIILLLAFVGQIEAHASNLLAYYPLDGDALDASGNGYNGTVSGTEVYDAGHTGQAFSFNGSTFISTLLDINASVQPQLTMGAWVRPSPGTFYGQLMTHDDQGFDRSLIHYGTDWRAYDGSDGGSVHTGPIPATDDWQFVAVVYDQDQQTVLLYVDGAVVSSTGQLLGPSVNTFHLGYNPSNNAEFFNGLVDEVFVVSGALSAAELDQALQNGILSVLTTDTDGDGIDDDEDNCPIVANPDQTDSDAPAPVTWTGEYVANTSTYLLPQEVTPPWTKTIPLVDGVPLADLTLEVVETSTFDNSTDILHTQAEWGAVSSPCAACHEPHSPSSQDNLLIPSDDYYPISYSISDASLDNTTGTSVEARLLNKATVGSSGLGLSISDGLYDVTLIIKNDRIFLFFSNSVGTNVNVEISPVYLMDTTDGFHTYTLRMQDNVAEALVDGSVVITHTVPSFVSTTDRKIRFGYHSHVNGSGAEWDYVKYYGGIVPYGDGAGDACDDCDFDPLKIDPGQCGCGIADTDTDLDGVADCVDKMELSYSSESGYGFDGLNPETGTTSTTFIYKVVYTNSDNQAPSSIMIHIDGDITGIALSLDTSAAAALQDGDYTNGEQYSYMTTLSVGSHDYYFTASDGVEAASLPLAGTLSGPTVVVETFILSVNKTGVGDGEVTSVPTGINCGATCSFAFNANTVVTLSATPYYPSGLYGWSGAGCSGTTSCVVLMDADKTVEAEFILPPMYTATPIAGANGNISPDTPQTVPFGDTVLFTVTPATGYHIDTVSGTCGGSLLGDTFTTDPITADCTVEATFVINTYTLTLSTTGTGSGIVTGAGTYNYGDTASVSATADTGSTFTGWSGTDGAECTTGSVNMIADKSCIATFDIKQYTITPIAGANGSISPDTPQTVTYGDVLVFTVTPGTGYHIDTVSGDGNCIMQPVYPYPGYEYAAAEYYTANIMGDCTVEATFAINSYIVTPIAGANGSISPDTPQQVAYGDQVVFTVTPDPGYQIDTVGGCNGDFIGDPLVGGDYGATITADCTVEATFETAIYALGVGKDGTGSGTVTSAPAGIDCGMDCQQLYYFNTVVTLTATPDADSDFDGWSGDADCTDGSVTMDGFKFCWATFTLKTFTLTASKDGTGSGTVTSVPAGINCGIDCSEVYEINTLVNLTATADTGSTFTGWSGSDGDECTTGSINMIADKSCTATFTLDTHTLALTTAGNGSGVVTGAGTYNYGDTASVSATADTGSTFTGWSGSDGDECTTGSINMIADKSCTATFTLDTHTLAGIYDVDDVCPTEDATGFDVNDDGCIDTVSDLLDAVSTLVTEGVVDQTMQNSLTSKINNAANLADTANICAAVNELGALKNQIEAQRGNKISNEAADVLINYTDSIIAYLLSQLPDGDSC
jgi:hypothetical protein